MPMNKRNRIEPWFLVQPPKRAEFLPSIHKIDGHIDGWARTHCGIKIRDTVHCAIEKARSWRVCKRCRACG